MADTLKAITSISFNPSAGQDGPAGEVPFTVEEDSSKEGEPLDYFARFATFSNSIQDLADGVHYIDSIEPIRYGRKTLKIYCPENSSPNLKLLSNTSGKSEILIYNVFISFGSFSYNFYAPSGYNNYNGNASPWNDYINKGRIQETVVEQITFSNSKEQRIKYWYTSPSVSITNSTQFVDQEGNSVPAPVLEGDTFKSEVECYGSFLVTYDTSYLKYWVYFDLSDIAGQMPVEIVTRKGFGTNNPYGTNITVPDKKYAIPLNNGNTNWQTQSFPLHVAVTLDHQMEFVTLQRKLTPQSFDNNSTFDNYVGDEEFSEIDRTAPTVRVENPDDPNQYVDVNRIKVITMQTSSGRTMILKLANLDA